MRCFCRRQTAALLWRFSFRMGSFAKDLFQPLVNRISIKPLEEYWPSYILSYSSKLNDLTGNERELIHLALFLVCHDKSDQQIQKKFITRNATMFSSKCETFAVQVAYAWVLELFSKWGGTSARQKTWKFLWFELATVTPQALKYDVINFCQDV